MHITHDTARAITRELLRQSWRSWASNDMRRVGPEWLQLVWTFVFAAGIAVVFTLFGALAQRQLPWENLATWWQAYRVNLVISLCVAYLIHGMFAVVIPWVGPERIRNFSGGRRALFFTSVPLLGVVIGWPLGVWLVSGSVGGWIRVSREGLIGSVTLSLLISGIVFMFFNSKARRIQAEKRATEARLRLLQGQIEPHFLFNTLANVQGLMDHDLPKARAMLSAFTDYLRTSLTTLRSDTSPLAAELDLAQSYLQLLQSRMEDRLRFTISADTAARAVPLPPLLLQPLVENAVVHGLEPAIDGGSVNVLARIEGRHLVLEVRDDGLGLDAPPRRQRKPGADLALDNIRQRLQTRYGDEARLEISAANPGTLARITLPIQGQPAA